MKTHDGTLKSNIGFPKLLTKFFHSPATVKPIVIVSRTLYSGVSLEF